MRNLIRRLLVWGMGTVVGAGAVLLVRGPGRSPPAPPLVPTIEQVRALSLLVTQRVEVSDVLVTRLEGYTGGVEASLLLRGDLDWGVDLSAARFEKLDVVTRSGVLVLPQARVSRPRVDHRRSRVVAVRENGLWRWVPGEDSEVALVNRSLEAAQKQIEQAAGERDLSARAAAHVEQVLGVFFQALGWRVRIRWDPGT